MLSNIKMAIQSYDDSVNPDNQTFAFQYITKMSDIPWKNFSRILTFLMMIIMLCFPYRAYSDVVKPALIEITVNTSGQISIEIRASIEALLTGINGQYKNTQDAPTAEEYDTLRKLKPAELAIAFEPFRTDLVNELSLYADQQLVSLTLAKISIPEPGYTKVPRVSLIILEGEISRQAEALSWYYPAKFGDNAVRVRQINPKEEKWHWSEWQWIQKDLQSQPFSLAALFTRQPQFTVITSYIKIGFDHIIPKGLDHILFILGIFLFSMKLRPLLAQVTMFTLAHTLTLGLSMNGIIDLSARIVEPLIALSIAYIGIENIFSRSLHNSRLLLVFGFGLLHGMGFAGVLSEFKMPDDEFVTALISFNVGVELGQVAVILLAYVLVAHWFRKRPGYRKVVVVPLSLLIAITGLFWTVERLEFL